MKANRFCIFRLLAGLMGVALGAGQAYGAVPLMAQQIEMMGARHWLGLMAGTVIARTSVLAPVTRRIHDSFERRLSPVHILPDDTSDHPSWRGTDTATGAGSGLPVDAN
jgi:hypothetical protein